MEPEGGEGIRLTLASCYPAIRGLLASYLQFERDIDVAGPSEGLGRRRAREQPRATDVVLLDGLCPDVHSREFVARLDEMLPEAVVLLTLTCQLSSELETFMEDLDRTWGHVAMCERPTAILDAVRTVAAGRARTPHESEGGLCPLRDRPLEVTLSDDERAVMKAIAQGLPNKEIARELGLSIRTVENQRYRLSRKLGIRTSAELIRYAVRGGIISP